MELDGYSGEILRREECFRLLGAAQIGRIGWTVRGLPSVLPVNFRVWGEHIVVNTGAPPAICGQVVAFQVDDLDRSRHGPWSVVVNGLAFKVPDATGWGAAIGITTEVVSGWRLRESAPR